MKNSRKQGILKYKYAILLTVLIFSLLRFINLDADPGMFVREGLSADEGYWGAEARNLILYGQYILDDFAQSAATAPLYTFFAYLFFKLFGVSLYVSRITCALFGGFTAFLLYGFLKQYDEKIALWSSLFLAVNFNYFIYNRMGLVETLVSFFIVLTFYCAENNHWVGAGICCVFMIYAKMTAIWFLPAIFLYILFKILRHEVNIKHVLYMVMGSLIPGIPLWCYQHAFQDAFALTLEGLSANMLSGGIPTLRLLFGAPLNLFMLFTNLYFINPINILLAICLILYLTRIKFIALFSRQFKTYIHKLEPLDNIIISWIFGYTISLILFSDLPDRRVQLLTVILSVVPGVVLFRTPDRPSSFRTLNIVQRIIWFSPLIILGTILGKQSFTLLFYDIVHAIVQSPYRVRVLLLYCAGLLCTGIVLGLTRRYRQWTNKTKRTMNRLMMLAFIGLITLPFVQYISSLGELPLVLKVFGFLVCLALVTLFAYKIDRNVHDIYILPVISVALIIVELAFPTFSIREASKALDNITTANDYVVGSFADYQLSFEAEYHPVLWTQKVKIYQNLNRDFVKKVKPQYWNHCEVWLGNEGGLDAYYPTWEDLQEIGATKYEKVHSYSLYPVFGKARAQFSFYKVFYTEQK